MAVPKFSVTPAPSKPEYTPYVAPTPYINQPGYSGYDTSQAIQKNNADPSKTVIPQGFVANPFYSQGGSNPQYASPADVRAVQDKSQQSYTSQMNTGGRMTEQQALDKGIDVNELRKSGLLQENTAPSAPYNSSNYEQYALDKGLDVNSPQFAEMRNQARAQQEAAIRKQEAANIEAATHEYDYLRQQLEGRKGDLQSSYDTGLRDLDTQMIQTQGAYTQNRDDLTQNVAQNKNEAYQNYQTAQRKNREMARALGSGTSSAYLDMQGYTNNSYNTTDANIGRDFTSKMNKLNNDWTAANQYAQNQKSTLAQQLQSGMRAIVLDQNATDFRKADAVAQLRAQANSQMASIDANLAQFQQQLAIQQQQLNSYAQMYAKTASPSLPSTNVSAYMSSGGQDLSAPIAQARTTGGIGANIDDRDKNTWLGDVGANFAWAGNTAKDNISRLFSGTY